MQREEFFEHVFSRESVSDQVCALRQAMEGAMDEAARQVDVAQRRLGGMRALKALKEDVMSIIDITSPSNEGNPVQFASRRMQLICAGTDAWVKLLDGFREREGHRVTRRDYREEHCGAPPFRDFDHEEVALVEAAATSEVSESGRRYAFDTVAPYVDRHGTRATRESAYRRWLSAREIGPDDLRDPGESELVGQRGIFAAVDIPAGTCVGAYGGQLLDEVDVFLLAENARYVMSLTPQDGVRGRVSLNGENLLSLSNTLFLRDAEGKVCGHPASGYNLEGTRFPARFEWGWQASVAAFFTTEDVARGSELRWNYRLQKV